MRLVRTQTSAVSEHTYETGHYPIWNEVKFIDRDPHWYTRRVMGGAVAQWSCGSESSGPGSSPGRGHCVVFLGKTLYSHSASLQPGV